MAPIGETGHPDRRSVRLLLAGSANPRRWLEGEKDCQPPFAFVLSNVAG
jgi:hypothetical protein